MKLLTRGLLALWGLFFATLALRGAIHPATWTHMFAITPEPHGVNTLRADFSAFFLVAALPALLVAARPKYSIVLAIPAALFGVALLVRLLGLALGDTSDESIHQAMLIELVTVLFMLGARAVLKGPEGVAALDNPS